MKDRSKIAIDWRLARDLLDLPVPLCSAMLRAVLIRIRANHSQEHLAAAWLQRDKRAARELLRGLLEVVSRQGATAARAKFRARQVAEITGIALIDQIGLLDSE